jgi:hypothetical protein
MPSSAKRRLPSSDSEKQHPRSHQKTQEGAPPRQGSHQLQGRTTWRLPGSDSEEQRSRSHTKTQKCARPRRGSCSYQRFTLRMFAEFCWQKKQRALDSKDLSSAKLLELFDELGGRRRRRLARRLARTARFRERLLQRPQENPASPEPSSAERAQGPTVLEEQLSDPGGSSSSRGPEVQCHFLDSDFSAQNFTLPP